MDNVITRIVDIEKQCAAEVEAADLEYAKKIEVHKRFLGEKMARERDEISAGKNSRISEAVKEAERQSREASDAFVRDMENLFRNQALNEEIKKDINSILLEG
jgi:hypothetical protein